MITHEEFIKRFGTKSEHIWQYIEPYLSEAEELKRANNNLRTIVFSEEACSTSVTAQITRLEAKISSLQSEIEKYQTFWNNLYTEHKELQSENERLKKQLEEKTLSNPKHPTK